MKKVIISLLAATGLGLSTIDFKPYNMKNINDFLVSQVENNKTPSIQYVFFDTDSIIYELRYGLSSVKSDQQVTPSTSYHLYSITKTFTALSVLQLAEAGKVDLRQPVSSYLSEFPYAKGITVQQLLNHTSGIPNPIPLEWIHLSKDHANFDHDKFFAEVFKANPRLDFAPGTRFKYSNLGYVFLGQLVERVTGQPFENYVDENITKRIGVSSTDLGFEINPSVHAVGYHKWWSLSNAVFGFLFDKEKFMGKREGPWKTFNLFYNNGTAYGGLFGSAPALVKYAQSLLQRDSVLISDRYKQLLLTETIVQNKPTGMSLSWFTGSLKGNQYFAHAGGGGGYYVELRIYPELGAGSVIMYNRSGMTDERILSQADGFFITEKNNAIIAASN
jgi:D-alanyl-D-alanine carboxypeptidase